MGITANKFGQRCNSQYNFQDSSTIESPKFIPANTSNNFRSTINFSKSTLLKNQKLSKSINFSIFVEKRSKNKMKITDNSKHE